MQSLQDGLVELEQSLRSLGKTGTADFFRSVLEELRSGNKRQMRKALDRLTTSAAIMQYAAFTNEQEALYLRISEEAQELRDSL